MGAEYYGDKKNPNAIVIRSTESVDGIEFYSPESFSQQIGLMRRPSGYVVPAHVHNEVQRSILHTQEVLLIRRGKCRVTLFSADLNKIHDIELTQGDVILLAHGAHQIDMIEMCEILEVKQGPYAGLNDKTHVKTIQ